MKELLIYLMQTLICSGAFLMLYRMIFMKHASYLFSRIYLITTPVIAFIIPLFSIPVYPGRIIYETAPYAFPVELTATTAVAMPEASAVNWTYIYAAVYVFIALAMLGVMVAEIVKLVKLKRSSSRLEDYGTPPVYESEKVSSPFSTAKSIFISQGLERHETEQIVTHETSHIRHRHFYEKTFLIALRTLMWYNPFLWISSRWLGELHEYEADKDVLAAGYDLTTYRTLILKQILGQNPDIACGLNNSLTKKRFIMMTSNPKKGGIILRTGISTVLACGLMMLFGFTRNADRYEPAAGTKAGTITLGQAAPGEIQTVKEKKQLLKEAKSCGLIILNGHEASAKELKDIKPENIGFIKVTKGNAEEATYGKKGANGVAVIESGSYMSHERAMKLLLDQSGLHPGNTPLIIIDEKEVTPQSLEKLAPDIIGSITVLKDNTATELYGKRGANGVVLVTTNGGKKSAGKPTKIATSNVTRLDKASNAAEALRTLTLDDAISDNQLIIIDTRESSKKELKDLDINHIKTVTVLKDSAAMKIHGRKGVNGVVIVETIDGAARPVGADAPKKDAPFIEAEVMPEFNGGNLSGFQSWVATRLKYPKEAAEKNIQGIVLVQFIIEKDGSMGPVTVTRSPHESLSNEITRVFSESPKWKPGSHKGEPVRIAFNVPVEFRLPVENAANSNSASGNAAKDEGPYINVEEMPIFQNGDLSTFRNWVQVRLQYPQQAVTDNVQGKVIASFVVEKDGSLSNATVLNSPDKSLSDEVLRVIKQSPKWTPGKEKGKLMRVRFTIPIDFILN